MRIDAFAGDPVRFYSAYTFPLYTLKIAPSEKHLHVK